MFVGGAVPQYNIVAPSSGQGWVRDLLKLGRQLRARLAQHLARLVCFRSAEEGGPVHQPVVATRCGTGEERSCHTDRGGSWA